MTGQRPGGYAGHEPMRRIGRALLHASSLVLALAIAAIATLACVLCFPPAELLRRAALPLARQELGLAQLDFGSLDFSLGRRGHLEIGDLYLGPPAGYALPLVTAKRISLRYDLRKLGSRHLRVELLELVDPVLRVERREGKPNWVALLETLDASPTEDAAAGSEQPDDPAAPFPLATASSPCGWTKPRESAPTWDCASPNPNGSSRC